MDRRTVLGIVLVLVAVMGAVAIGTNAYRAGVARGLEESGKLPAPGAGAPPYPYYGPHWYYGPFWHHGPFGFGFLFPLLFLFLIFSLFRRRHWAGHHGSWKTAGVPPMFEEWHRRAHEPQEPSQKV